MRKEIEIDWAQLVIGEAPEEVPGVAELKAFYGYFPSFHDAEVLFVHMDRSGPLTLGIHTRESTEEVDECGCYVLHKHIIVTFSLNSLGDSQLEGFNQQNVLNGLYLRRLGDGYQLILDSCYGLRAVINCESVKLEFQPGEPDDRLG